MDPVFIDSSKILHLLADLDDIVIIDKGTVRIVIFHAGNAKHIYKVEETTVRRRKEWNHNETLILL